MGTRTTIKKIVFICFWVMVSGGILSLLIAAIGKKNKGISSGYSIAVNEGRESFFFEEKDISNLLNPVLENELQHKKIADIDLKRYEALLRDNVWISQAELWFDSRNHLHISVDEKKPMARVFTRGRHSFYMDEKKGIMPLSEKKAIQLPVFTGFPSDKDLSKEDSLLLERIYEIASFISSDIFWSKQVAQVNITDEREFEMVPVIGDHIVMLGDGSEIEKKLERLMIFYKQVLSKTGLDKYKMIDVQYKRQVIGTKSKDKNVGTDMAILRRNVEKLLENTDKPDEEIKSTELLPDSSAGTEKVEVRISGEPGTDVKSNVPNSVKTESLPSQEQKKEETKIPKAVMPKRDSTNKEQKNQR